MKEYNFAFVFSRIEMSERQKNIIQPFTHFKIQLYSNKHFVNSTEQKLCQPTQQNFIDLQEETIQFTFMKTINNYDQNCEIKFIEIVDQHNSQTIGVYEFMLNNYIIAYEEYNRNIVQLNVQISPQYSLVYDVFIQKTSEALKKIIKQHEFTKKKSFQNDFVRQNSFLPQEIHHQNMDTIYKQINYDMNSPAIMRKRYWSPMRKKKSRISSKDKSRIFYSEQKSKNTNDTTISQNRITFFRMSRKQSTYSDLQPPQLNKFISQNSGLNNSVDAEIQLYPQENQLQLQNKQKLIYNVIQQNSRISNDYLSNSSKSGSQKQLSQRSSIKKKQSFIKKNKDRNGYLKLAKVIVMIIIVIFLIATLLDNFGWPSLKIKRIKYKRYNSFQH